MRTLKLALAAAAAFAFNANAQVIGMGNPPAATYQPTEYAGSTLPGQELGNGRLEVFHAGGVAACDGCHVMHNAQYGVAKSTTGRGNSVQPWTNVTNAYLLQGSDQSSTCLICHGNSGAQTHQFTIATLDASLASAPVNFTPGGDFAWTNLDFAASPSNRHGHNVVAADFPGFAADTLLNAPGGTYVATATGIRAFACSSCHDPHGRYRRQDNAGTIEWAGPSSVGNTIDPIISSGSYGFEPTADGAVGAYRLLGGQGYAPASNPAYPFPNNPPVAVAPTLYNSSENVQEVRVAYGSGMSEWCQNCHTNIHLDGYTTGVAGLRHPAGSDAFLRTTQIEIYNAYVQSGDMSAPAATGAYTSLVPFEQTSADLATLIANTDPAANVLAGPQSAVMCLSCHRAHASAFDSMIRWDQNATFLTDGTGAGAIFTPGLTDRSEALTEAGYYGRTAATIGSNQRSLCNKCHGKD